jgi:holo-[acyl-carrier protein] synthase
MMALRNGVDLVEIERIDQAVQRHGARFLQRVFTPAELAQANRSPASLAVRFAAKEATAKALGTGIGLVSWQEIEVLREYDQSPTLRLSGMAKQLAASLGLTTWTLSLSHTRTLAIASVVAAGDEDQQQNR